MTDVGTIGPPGVAGSATRLGLDARIAALAARQGGVVGRRQLETLGLSKSGVSARIARGVLHPVYRGVFGVGHPLVHGRGLEHAALMACGPGTALSHRSAGAGWELRPWRSRTVEVTAGPGRRSRPGLVVHRGRLAAQDVVVVDGLPRTTVARTLLDLAEVLAHEPWARAWEQAERLQLLDLGAVRELVDRSPGRRGLALVLPRLAEHLEGVADTRSPLEVDFLRWAARHLAAFPPPLVNAKVLGFEVDAWWAEAKVVVELDSRLHHLDPVAFERDRAKWAALTAGGHAVFALTARRLRRDAAAAAGELTRALTVRWGR